jgi:ubiquitin C-terminal hydrolase
MSIPLTEMRNFNNTFQLFKVFAYLEVTKRKSFSPNTFIDSLPQFYKNGEQQDSSEFGRYIIDKISEELKNSEHKNIISDIFSGEFINVIQCKSCSNLSKRAETFIDITLSLPDTEYSRIFFFYFFIFLFFYFINRKFRRSLEVFFYRRVN